MPKQSGDPQVFHFGKAVAVTFTWKSWVSCRVNYGNDPGTAVAVEPRIVRLEAAEDVEPTVHRGDRRYWFAYWISTPDTRRRSGEALRFGGAGPVLSEQDLLALLKKARREEGFFTSGFWKELASVAS